MIMTPATTEATNLLGQEDQVQTDVRRQEILDEVFGKSVLGVEFHPIDVLESVVVGYEE